jgi:hypothetical protein
MKFENAIRGSDLYHIADEPRRLLLRLQLRGDGPFSTKQERDMTYELSINQLDGVSGGLARNPDKDAANQRAANANRGDGTFGSSIGGILVGPATGGAGSTGGHPFDYPSP